MSSMQLYYNPTFAQAYSQGTYGGCAYNQNTVGCAPNGGAANGGGLTNTGFVVVVIVTAACLMMLIGILVRFWRRTAKAKLELQVQPDREVEEIDARSTTDQ